MKNGRNTARAVCIGLAVILLGGCSSSGGLDDYATNKGYQTAAVQPDAAQEEKTDEKNQNKSQIAKEDLQIGVLHISDPAEGSGYSYTHDLGIQGMQKNLGLADEQVERKIASDGEDEAIRRAMDELIADGCNVIFTTSWGYMKITAEYAERYPDIYFSHGTGYMCNGTNFNNYFGRIYQARYLSGIVAGMNTTTNKIGYVAAMGSDNSEVTGGIDAFSIGVASVNPEAKIYVKVTNSWYDPQAEKTAAQILLDMDCDVLAQHCDTAFPQTLAQEKGVYSIGYNSDMSKEAPESCLCSVIWNWSAYYTSAVKELIDGTWDGSNYYGGMAEGLVDLTDLAKFCAEGTQEKVEAERTRILKGEFDVFDGVILTNEGKSVGKEGERLDDATITGGINWYYQNVTVVE